MNLLTQAALAAFPVILKEILNRTEGTPTTAQDVTAAVIARGGTPPAPDVAEIIAQVCSFGLSALVLDDAAEVDTLSEAIVQLAAPYMPGAFNTAAQFLTGAPVAVPMSWEAQATSMATDSPWITPALAPWLVGEPKSGATCDPSIEPADVFEATQRAMAYGRSAVVVARAFGYNTNSITEALRWLHGTVTKPAENERFDVSVHCQGGFLPNLIRVVTESDPLVLQALSLYNVVNL